MCDCHSGIKGVLLIDLIDWPSLYRVVQNAFRYLEPFRRGSRVWQTDRRTDRENRRALKIEFICWSKVSAVRWVTMCMMSACNAISTTSDGSATLSNYALRRNCSLLFLYPELIDIIRLDVGRITTPRTRTSSTVVGETQRHRQFHAVINIPSRTNLCPIKDVFTSGTKISAVADKPCDT